MELLQMKEITKEFSENRVLKEVSLSIKKGEIHGLVGETGAGKSTLMNILFGMPIIHSTGGFEGKMFFNGKEFNPKSPNDAMNIGILSYNQLFISLTNFIDKK